MEINLELLIEHIKYTGEVINISFETESSTSTLVLERGKSRDNGSNRICLHFSDFSEILLKNNILGDNGKLAHEKRKLNENNSIEKGNLIKKFEINIEKLIYETLAKYIFQMLNASKGKIYFPEIICLEVHKNFFCG